MVYIDCHCHLDFYKDDEIEDIICRAREKNVRIIVNNSVSPDSIHKSLDLSKKYPEIKTAAGIYPVEGFNIEEKEFKETLNFIKRNKERIVAIGEVGLDLKELDSLDKQKENFIEFIRLSIELNKPIIVHSRKAEKEAIEILEKENAKKVIMHCFNGDFKSIKRIIENKWTITIPTNSTFSEHFQKVILKVPIDQLLCETDSPFLHPVRGERNNTPENVVEGYKKISEIKKMGLKEVERKIEDNFKRLFLE